MRNIVVLSVVLATLGLSVACAPQAAPAPSPTQAAKVPVSVPTSTATPQPAQDSAWAKVVEAAQKEGKVTVYSYNFSGDVAVAMSKAFKDKYGIDVESITGTGSSFVEKLKTEKRLSAIVGDIYEGAGTFALSMKESGLTSPMDTPTMKEKGVWSLDPSALDPDGHIVYYSILLYPIISNTNLLKPQDEPTSYYDLLKPQWKGKMLFIDPEVGSTFYTVFQTMMNRGLLKQDYMSQLAQQDLKYTKSLFDLARMVATGEFVLGQGTDAQTAPMVAQGAPLKALSMKEGTISTGVVMSLIKDSPHPNAARVFANWLLSPEGAKISSDLLKATSVRKDVPNPMPTALRFSGNLIALTGDEVKTANDSYSKKLWSPMLKGSK